MEFEVFYDGDCPLCVREINLLKRLDRSDKIVFSDIANPDFDPSSVGLSMDQLMTRIHGRDAGGNLVEGVEVFRRLYGAVGFHRTVQLTRLPGIRGALNVAYTLFAQNRLKLTGRCIDGSCAIPNAPLQSTPLSSS